MTLNLGGAQRAVEKLMESEVIIQHPGREVLNPVDGTVSQTMTTVYDGKAIVATDTTPEFYRPDSGERGRVYYTVFLPKDEAVTVTAYDIITITVNDRQPNMVGKRLTAIGPVAGTFEVAYRIRAWLDEESGE